MRSLRRWSWASMVCHALSQRLSLVTMLLYIEMNHTAKAATIATMIRMTTSMISSLCQATDTVRMVDLVLPDSIPCCALFGQWGRSDKARPWRTATSQQVSVPAQVEGLGFERRCAVACGHAVERRNVDGCGWVWRCRAYDGGGGGIRTLGTGLPLDGFQDRCIRPLCHPSA